MEISFIWREHGGWGRSNQHHQNKESVWFSELKVFKKKKKTKRHNDVGDLCKQNNRSKNIGERFVFLWYGLHRVQFTVFDVQSMNSDRCVVMQSPQQSRWRTVPSPPKILLCNFVVKPYLHSQPLATSDLFSSLTLLSLPEYLLN